MSETETVNVYHYLPVGPVLKRAIRMMLSDGLPGWWTPENAPFAGFRFVVDDETEELEPEGPDISIVEYSQPRVGHLERRPGLIISLMVNLVMPATTVEEEWNMAYESVSTLLGGRLITDPEDWPAGDETDGVSHPLAGRLNQFAEMFPDSQFHVWEVGVAPVEMFRATAEAGGAYSASWALEITASRTE